MAKLEFIIKRGRIHIGGSGKRVLEIGSGWGSFSILVRLRFLVSSSSVLIVSDKWQL